MLPNVRGMSKNNLLLLSTKKNVIADDIAPTSMIINWCYVDEQPCTLPWTPSLTCAFFVLTMSAYVRFLLVNMPVWLSDFLGTSCKKCVPTFRISCRNISWCVYVWFVLGLCDEACYQRKLPTQKKQTVVKIDFYGVFAIFVLSTDGPFCSVDPYQNSVRIK